MTIKTNLKSERFILVALMVVLAFMIYSASDHQLITLAFVALLLSVGYHLSSTAREKRLENAANQICSLFDTGEGRRSPSEQLLQLNDVLAEKVGNPGFR